MTRRLSLIRQAMIDQGAGSESLDLAQCRRFRRVYLANHVAARDFEPRTYDGPVCFIGAKQGIQTAPDWKPVLGNMTLIELDCNHLDLLKEPSIHLLLQ
ncbi:MAG: hypothetical protein QNK37_22605 [Acidobacteriota bacterium]|nr:hypothetical protein [Acidobacteriota bacterium]